MKNRKYLSMFVYMVLLMMSIFANKFPVLVDSGLTVIIPTIFLLIILSLYGLPIGVVSALITAGAGLYSDGSIVDFLLLVTEITAVGLLLKYRNLGEFHSVLLYWLVFGLPIFTVYTYVFSELDGWFAALVLLSRLLNNILCALVAEILLTYIPFRKWVHGFETKTISVQLLISHVVLAAIALPNFIYIIGDIQYTQNQIAPVRNLDMREIKGFAFGYANLLLFIILGIGFIAIIKVYIMRNFSQLSETTTGLPKKLKGLARIDWPTSRMVEFNKLTENFKEMSFELTEMFNELQESKNRLHFMAYYDSLTGMKNRPYFMGVLKDSVESARKGNPHALLFMDLNGFKGINDTYGHETGDVVLQQIAKRLTVTCGEKGLLARLGGDEFVVLLPYSSKELAAEMADSIIKQVEKPIHFNGYIIQVGISIGISLYLHDSHSVDELMHHGDMAMYASKDSEGSRFTFYDSIAQRGLQHGLEKDISS